MGLGRSCRPRDSGAHAAQQLKPARRDAVLPNEREVQGPQLKSRPCAQQRRPSATTTKFLFKVNICQRPGGISRGTPDRGRSPSQEHMVRTAIQRGRSGPRTMVLGGGCSVGISSELGRGPPWALSRAPRLGHFRGLLTRLGQHGPLGALREDVRSTWSGYADRLLAGRRLRQPASVRGCGRRCHASHGAFLKKWATRTRGPGRGGPGPQVPQEPSAGTQAGLQWTRGIPGSGGVRREGCPVGCGEAWGDLWGPPECRPGGLC